MTEIDQPAIFGIAELSKKWYNSLPADLQQILDKDAAAATAALNPWVIDFNAKARKAWTAAGGELISLPPDEQSAMLQIAGERRRGCIQDQAAACRCLQNHHRCGEVSRDHAEEIFIVRQAAIL